MNLPFVEPIKVLCGEKGNAAYYYRAYTPLRLMTYQTEHTLTSTTLNTSQVQTHDVLWLQQHVTPQTEIVAREFVEAGKPIIYDVDDWLFGVPPSWPCYRHFFDTRTGQANETLKIHERLLRMATVVTCTTKKLAERLTDLLGPHSDVRVLPNCVLQGDWDTVLPSAHNLDGPVLGWFGTDNHWDDWMEIAEIVDDAIEWTGGYLVLIGAPSLVAALPQRLAKRTFVQPPVSIDGFGEMRSQIKSFDIGLAWCTPRISANAYRSPLKALQYGAAGVYTVASKTVYDENLPELRNLGTIVPSPDELYDVLVDVLFGASVYRESAGDWQKEVWEFHTYETQASKWIDLVEEVVYGTA